MSKFHKLRIQDIKRETADCVSISFEIPHELKSEFDYKQGQYLTLKTEINGEELRRSYSVCSSPTADNQLRIAVKRVENGRMSTYINRELKEGDALDVMTPMGNFFTEMPTKDPQHYVAFAAGSGITPIMSLLKTALKADPQNKFTLFYGNKSNKDIIFKEEIDALEASNPERLKIVHLLSRETTADPLFSGRMNAEKCGELIARYENVKAADEYFICGPYDMIMDIKSELTERGISEDKIHFELFSTPAGSEDAQETSDAAAASESFSGQAAVTIVLDGEETEITVGEDETILDAALDAGLDAPYACTGGSCCTCRAKVMEGEAEMEVNYALTDKEVKGGYILTCQSHPTTSKLVVDYDEP